MLAEFRSPKADRLDRILRGSVWPGSEWLSRQGWDWLLEHGHVAVNGRSARKAGQALAEGDLVEVRFPGPLGLLPAEHAPEPVWRAQDRSLAVFSKAAGVDTLPLFPWDQTTFASQAAAFAIASGWLPPGAFPLLAEPPFLEGGVLQRLDRNTSGLITVAFTAPRKAAFRQAIAQSKVEKTYLALVTSVPKEGEHAVWLSGSGAKVKAVLAGEPSEASRLLVRIRSRSALGALVEIETRQGARHIVRAGLAALGAPLLGDSLYGGEGGAPYHQLHASRLRFPEPAADVSVPPPAEFLDSSAKLGLHWQG